MSNFNQYCEIPFGYGRFAWGGVALLILVLVLLAVFLYLIFRKGGFSHHSSQGESPLDLLQKRFVNGEISKDEYLEKKEILKGKD
ncbi:MAG: SHOCT domain-containing protein [Spirochaetales bacterium]|nr:SHOCT domain-containing protein [Spirochaetales bacterium]